MLFQLLVLLLHLLTSEYQGALLLTSAQCLGWRNLRNGVCLFFTFSWWLYQILMHRWYHIWFVLTVRYSLRILLNLSFLTTKVSADCSRALRSATPRITISDCRCVWIDSSWLVTMLRHIVSGAVGGCDLRTLSIGMLLTLSYAKATRSVFATVIERCLLLFLFLLQILTLLSLEIDELPR